MSNPILVWFRNDLRINNNPALRAALVEKKPILPVYIWSPEEEAPWAPGAAHRWWLHHSLVALSHELKRRGSRLILREGPTQKTLETLMNQSKVSAIHWNRRYEPSIIRRDSQLKQRLSERWMVKSFNASLLHEPWEIQTQAGQPYRVFTPFWRACQDRPPPHDLDPAPTKLPPVSPTLESCDIEQLRLLPTIPWDAGIEKQWTPGEAAAQNALNHFVQNALPTYPEMRNIPSEPGTSRLSAALHFGEISPRQIAHALKGVHGAHRNTFWNEIGWREFAYHLMYHFPDTPDQPLRPGFRKFPWSTDSARTDAWKKGRTGFPIVDAGMRELWQTGWMHNRVRMIVASFLVKDLSISWTHGAKWFWDTLVDADLANNTLGWQWSAGCGADAAPYFRVFNPASQGEKFDPEGRYVRRWIPELEKMPSKWIHAPEKAPPEVARSAGVILGKTYPFPMVDHAQARVRFIQNASRVLAAPSVQDA